MKKNSEYPIVYQVTIHNQANGIRHKTKSFDNEQIAIGYFDTLQLGKYEIARVDRLQGWDSKLITRKEGWKMLGLTEKPNLSRDLFKP